MGGERGAAERRTPHGAPTGGSCLRAVPRSPWWGGGPSRLRSRARPGGEWEGHSRVADPPPGDPPLRCRCRVHL